jgi:hypothetical protein
VGFKSRHSAPTLARERDPLERLDLLVAFLRRSADRLVAPGVVDHIAPAAVCLAPRHLGRRSAKHDWVAVWPGTRQRPGVGQIGQLANGDHQLWVPGRWESAGGSWTAANAGILDFAQWL